MCPREISQRSVGVVQHAGGDDGVDALDVLTEVLVRNEHSLGFS